jgi:MFS family permease
MLRLFRSRQCSGITPFTLFTQHDAFYASGVHFIMVVVTSAPPARTAQSVEPHSTEQTSSSVLIPMPHPETPEPAGHDGAPPGTLPPGTLPPGTLGDRLPAALAKANYWHLVGDVAFFGLGFAALSRFLSVFAIRLGATPTELSLITSLPALMLMIGSIWGVGWMRRYITSRGAHRLPSLVWRFTFLLPVFALLLPERWRPLWLIASITVPALFQALAAVSFTCMMRDAVRSDEITRLLSLRSVMLNITHAVSAIGFGLLLDHVLFPTNYVVMFVLAFVFNLISDRYCALVRVQPQARDAIDAGDAQTRAAFNPWRSGAFRQVAFVVLVAHIGFFSISALVPLYMVNTLGATEGFFALFGLVELAAGALISLVTAQIIGRIGYRTMIAWGMVGTAVGGLFIVLASDLNVTLIGAFITGAAWTAAATVGMFGFLTQNTPPQATAAYSSAYHQVIGLAVFVGPLVGGLLAEASENLVPIMLFGVALRLAAAPLIELSGSLVASSSARSLRWWRSHGHTAA